MKKEFEGINEYMKSKAYREKCKILGNNIKYYRKKKRLTEMQLGKKIGKSRKFISLIEYPQYNKEIYIDSLFDISRALDVDIYYFLLTLNKNTFKIHSNHILIKHGRFFHPKYVSF